MPTSPPPSVAVYIHSSKFLLFFWLPAPLAVTVELPPSWLPLARSPRFVVPLPPPYPSVLILSQDQRSTIYTISGCCYSTFITAKMPVTHQRDILQNLGVFLFVIEFSIMICRQKGKNLNPGLPPALQPAASASPPPPPPPHIHTPPRRKRKPQNP